MDFFSTYHAQLFATPEGDAYCAVLKRGTTIVGVGCGETKGGALRTARERLRLHHTAARGVRELMAEYSERVFSAGWHLGLEERLYLSAFGSEHLEPFPAALRQLAETIGIWWIWPDDVAGGPVCISLAEAHRRFARESRP